MTHVTKSSLPHHGLHAYQVSVELLLAVRRSAGRDRTLHEHALRSAKSVCLNIAEAAGRVGARDRQRVFAIARGELAELAAAVEIGALMGDVESAKAAEVDTLARRLAALLRGLLR